MTTFDDVRGHAIVCGLQKTLDYLMEGATPLELFALGEVLAHQAAQKAKRENAEAEVHAWPGSLQPHERALHGQAMAPTLAQYRQES